MEVMLLSNINKEIEIKNTLRFYNHELFRKGYTVAFISLYGSQNYGLDVYTDEYKSDIDAKAVIIPTLDDLIYNCKPKSFVLDFDQGQVDVKDIRIFIDTLIKANPAYIETLYSDYMIINQEYKEQVENILNLKDELVYVLRCQFIKAIYGMMMEKRNAMCHPYPSIVEKIEKYGFDGKQTSHCIRLLYLMKDYFLNHINDKNLKPCFYPNKYQREILLNHKLNKIDIETATKEADEAIDAAKKIRDDILDSVDQSKIDYSVKDKIVKLSRDIIKENIINKIKEE